MWFNFDKRHQDGHDLRGARINFGGFEIRREQNCGARPGQSRQNPAP
jgi:hypothetical protein